jgi:hypothetical protein
MVDCNKHLKRQHYIVKKKGVSNEWRFLHFQQKQFNCLISFEWQKKRVSIGKKKVKIPSTSLQLQSVCKIVATENKKVFEIH